MNTNSAIPLNKKADFGKNTLEAKRKEDIVMKKDTDKKSLKRQLISGGIYIALSAVVASVAINGAVKLLSKDVVDSLDSLPNPDSISIPPVSDLPEIPDISQILLPESNTNPPEEPTLIPESDSSVAVSDSPSGISAVVTEDVPSDTAEQITDISENKDISYILPCEGFVVKGFSPDVPVFSETMSDYRVHLGIDIACEENCNIKAVADGKISSISNDTFSGVTVSIEQADGHLVKYANLSENIPSGISEGSFINAGTIVGCIGNTSLSEATEPPHLHLEIYKDGSAVNPEDLLDI